MLRILKYGSVNVVLLPGNLFVAWILTRYGLHYLFATFFGFAFQVTLAFFINRVWTFARRDISATTGLARAYLVETSSFFVVIGSTWMCVEVFDFEFTWARGIAVVVSGVWCYILDATFTFRVGVFVRS